MKDERIQEKLPPHVIVAILSASELSLGSYLHTLRIPFTGQLMSLNQCFWLNVAKLGSAETSTTHISAQVAAVKMMSPLGKRITPMIGISMQGLLFEFGNKLGGRLLGSVCLGIWGFIQPFLLYFLFLGTTLQEIFEYFSASLDINLYLCIALLLSLKIFLSIAVSFAAARMPFPLLYRFGSWIQSLENKLTLGKSSRPSWKKMLRSPVTFAILLLAIYLYFTADSVELFLRKTIFYLLWSIAVYRLIDLFGKKILRYAIKVMGSPTEISQESE